MCGPTSGTQSRVIGWRSATRGPRRRSPHDHDPGAVPPGADRLPAAAPRRAVPPPPEPPVLGAAPPHHEAAVLAAAAGEARLRRVSGQTAETRARLSVPSAMMGDVAPLLDTTQPILGRDRELSLLADLLGL